jgi:hypothetical protein
MGRASLSTSSIAAASLALALVAAALLAAGCGSSGSGSGDESSSAPAADPAGASPGATAKSCTAGMQGVATLRATGVSCATAVQVAAGWTASPGCVPSGGSTRTSCEVGRYRCLGLPADRGVAVSCARPGRSVSFLAHRSYNGQRPPT